MGQSLPAAPHGAREVVADNRTEFHPVEIIAEVRNWFPGLSKKLSKDKPSAAVHHLIGGDIIARIRTVYDWCSGVNDPPALALIKLLHSEAGWIVLTYLMRGCTQRWWLDMERERKLAAVAQRFKAELEQIDFKFE